MGALANKLRDGLHVGWVTVESVEGSSRVAAEGDELGNMRDAVRRCHRWGGVNIDSCEEHLVRWSEIVIVALDAAMATVEIGVDVVANVLQGGRCFLRVRAPRRSEQNEREVVRLDCCVE